MFWKKEEEKPWIRFRHADHHKDTFPKPQRASKFMPEWYKNLQKDIPGSAMGEAGTVRRCVPVLDSICNGYIIPAWCDHHVSVKWEEGEDGEPVKTIFVSIPGDIGLAEKVGTHGWQQVGDQCPIKKFPMGQVLLKFINPWVIETPPGYSVLFKSPPHQFSDVHIMEGVVDTDEYHRQIHFPFFWSGQDEGEYTIKTGDPLVHVVPFKRESYDIEFDSWDHDRMTHIDVKHNTKFFDRYKQLWWSKRK